MKTQIEKAQSHTFKKDVYLLGKDEQGIKYWLEAPSWDCEWYWGFGYVETYQRNAEPSRAKDIDSHQHIQGSFMGQMEKYNYDKGCFIKADYVHNIYDAPILTETTFTEAEGWELSELFKQFYFLKEAAENFGWGKCHVAHAKIEIWKDEAKVKEINEVIIPKVTARIIEILKPV